MIRYRKLRAAIFVLVLFFSLSSSVELKLVLSDMSLGGLVAIKVKRNEVYGDNSYYYSKYNTITSIASYSQSTFAFYTRMGPYCEGSPSLYMRGCESYDFNPQTGIYYAPFSYEGFGSYVYSSTNDPYIYKQMKKYAYRQREEGEYINYYYIETYESHAIPNYTYSKGTIVQSGIIAADGTYPNNGKHTDGYWYVKVTALPQITDVSEPTQNKMYGGNDTAIFPSISTIDIDSSTLTCKYYLDTESTPRSTVTVTGNAQMVKFPVAINMSQLSEGVTHTIKFTVEDGISIKSETRTFTVDKTKPALSNMSSTITDKSISLSCTATDNASSDGILYKFTIGSSGCDWKTTPEYSSSVLIPNTQYSITYNAKDKVGNIATSTQNIYTDAQLPKFLIENPTTTTLDIRHIGDNPSNTQYVISVGSKYVDQSGALTSTQTWVTFVNNKKTITGLSSGISYNIKLKAKNTANKATIDSAIQVGTTKVTMPTVSASAATADSIKVTWLPVVGAVGYEVEIDNDTSNLRFVTDTLFLHNSLAPNSLHSYKVRAKNALPGDWSDRVSKYTLANAPNNGNVSQTTINSINAEWGFNSNPTGTKYTLAAFDSNGIFVKQNDWITSISDSITSLNSKTQYIIKVKAKNNDGIETAWYQINTVSTLPNLPEKPHIISGIPSKDKIVLCWSAVEGEIKYEVRLTKTIDNSLIDSTDIIETTKEVSGLLPNTEYKCEVQAWNGDGPSGWSPALIVSTLPEPPEAPVPRIDLVDTDSVSLSWPAVENADNYYIKVDGKLQEDNVISRTYTHGGLEPGTFHEYEVIAENSGGPSSTRIAVYTKLIIPKKIVSTSMSEKITVRWEPVEKALSYDVLFDNTLYKNVESNVFITSGLNPDTLYKYKVMARNGTTSSDWSEENNKTTLPKPPGKVMGVDSSSAQESITITWDKVLDAVGYEIKIDNTKVINTGDNTSFEHYGLTPDTPHSYCMRARNSGGKGDWSESITATTLSLDINKPQNLRAVKGENLITIEWDPVLNSDKYFIQVDSSENMTVTQAVYEHVGVDMMVPHQYRVASVVSGVTSEWNELVVSMGTTGQIPDNFIADQSENTIILNWDSCDEVTGYDIESNNSVIAENIPATTYIHEGIEPQKQYFYRVRTNKDGITGSWSGYISVMTQPGSIAVPVGLKATPSTDSILLTWEYNPNATDYDIKIDEEVIEGIKDISYTHTGLLQGAEYTYVVRSKVDGQPSNWSDPITCSALPDVIGKPENIGYIATSDSIDLYWDFVDSAIAYDINIDNTTQVTVTEAVYEHSGLEPLSNHQYEVRAIKGGNVFSDWSIVNACTLPALPEIPSNVNVASEPTSFTISWDNVIGSTGYDIKIDKEVIDVGSAFTYTVNDLPPRSQHTVSIRARNTTGDGKWSMSMTVLLQTGVSGAPTNISCIASTDNVKITWAEVPGALSYEVEVDGIGTNIGLNTKHENLNLQAGTQYRYRIGAKMEDDTIVWSAPVNIWTLLKKPSVNTIPNADYINLTWDKIDGATEYTVEIDGGSQPDCTTPIYTHSGLTYGTTYEYRVKAKNIATESEWSDPVIGQPIGYKCAIDCTTNELYNITIHAENVLAGSNATFSIVYNADELEVVDLCSSTQKLESTLGQIEGTDITITSITSGKIEFTLAGVLNQEEALDGVVNSMAFRAKKTGISELIYSVR